MTTPSATDAAAGPLTLAVEQSTPRASVALLRGERLAAQLAWEDDHGRHQRLFQELPAWLAAQGVGLSAIDRYAVGLGPGGFTGLRIALSALRAYALPSATPVTGVASDAALALRVAADTDVDTVCVVGDARRGRLWLARYELRDGFPELRGGRLLAPAAEISADRFAGAAIVSPEWERVRELLTPDCCAAAARIVGAAVPQAADVGALALASLARGAPAEPLTPMYLHPAVLIAPRFSDEGTRLPS